jgi:DNA-binding CsgD family transcriptional regulator
MKVITPAIKTIDTIDKKILGLMTDGKSIKQIALEANLTSHQVAGRIREMKKYYNCHSIAQLIKRVDGL